MVRRPAPGNSFAPSERAGRRDIFSTGCAALHPWLHPGAPSGQRPEGISVGLAGPVRACAAFRPLRVASSLLRERCAFGSMPVQKSGTRTLWPTRSHAGRAGNVDCWPLPCFAGTPRSLVARFRERFRCQRREQDFDRIRRFVGPAFSWNCARNAHGVVGIFNGT